MRILSSPLRMEFIGGSDENRVDVLALRHFLEAGVKVVNLEFIGDLSRTRGGHIGHRYEPCFRDEPSTILGVPFAHFSDA